MYSFYRRSSINMRVFYSLLLVFIFAGIYSFGNDRGYDIKIKLDGVNDSVLYLANYYGDKTYLADTAFPNKKGTFRFEGDSLLPGGIYIIAGQNSNKYFEILVDKEQHFTIETTVPDVIHGAKISGSNENQLFSIIFEKQWLQKNGQEELTRRKNLITDKDSLHLITEEINREESRFQHYKDSLALANNGSLLAGIINALKEIKPENVPLLENGREDSIYSYNYYKQHYWDYFDLTDDRLLRTPLFTLNWKPILRKLFINCLIR
ncbi:MAG: DUF4369 domain-containing protein [Bacteroidales bacterium]